MINILKTAMTADQFKQLLEQNNTRLLAHIGEQLDERLGQSNAALFGQLAQYLDKQFDSLHDELKTDTSRIYTAIDGIAKRLTTDELERAAITGEQNRQNNWIGELAKSTGTRLIPEQ
jgi:hypothetical protein